MLHMTNLLATNKIISNYDFPEFLQSIKSVKLLAKREVSLPFLCACPIVHTVQIAVGRTNQTHKYRETSFPTKHHDRLLHSVKVRAILVPKVALPHPCAGPTVHAVQVADGGAIVKPPPALHHGCAVVVRIVVIIHIPGAEALPAGQIYKFWRLRSVVEAVACNIYSTT